MNEYKKQKCILENGDIEETRDFMTLAKEAKEKVWNTQENLDLDKELEMAIQQKALETTGK